MEHLQKVIVRLAEVGLKLKLTKCCFVCKEMEYLGHLITPEANPQIVTAVREFPVPRNIQEVCRFLGLSSYYRKFIAEFAKVAQPFHKCNCKDTKFEWSSPCQSAFDYLN